MQADATRLFATLILTERSFCIFLQFIAMDKIDGASNENDETPVNSLGIGNSAPYIPSFLLSTSFSSIDQYLHDDVIAASEGKPIILDSNVAINGYICVFDLFI